MDDNHMNRKNEEDIIEAEITADSDGQDGDQSTDDGRHDSSAENGEKGGGDGGAEHFCSICHRPESVTGKLMELPGGMYVCQDCMQRGFDAFQNTGLSNLNDFFNENGFGIYDLSNLGRGAAPRQVKKPQKEKKEDEFAKMTMADVPKPHIIKHRLDEYVIGQEHAKKIMSVAVYNHYKRILSDEKDEDLQIQKSNMLMIGPTGSGKTYLVQTLARMLHVPLAMTDATSLTEAGYIGDDIESVISKLLAAADNDVERAQHGIVFIDEIDKIAKKKNTNQRDVSGEAVQQGLLKLLEGSEVEVPVGATSKNAMVPLVTVDTTNILFICGGAFPDLEDIVRERLNRTSSMGFQADLRDKYDEDRDILQKVTMEDLRAFGMIPEFLGRLPIVFSLDALTEDMLVRILREPRNAILKQYEKLLALDGVKLSFEDGALHAIARKAMSRETGARALRAIIEEFMLDIMYEIPKDSNIGEVIITEEYVEHRGGPKVLMKGSPELAGGAV